MSVKSMCPVLKLCVFVNLLISVRSGGGKPEDNPNRIYLNLTEKRVNGQVIIECISGSKYTLLEGSPTEVVVNHKSLMQNAWCTVSSGEVANMNAIPSTKMGVTVLKINSKIATGTWKCEFTSGYYNEYHSICTIPVRVRWLDGPIMYANGAPIMAWRLNLDTTEYDYIGQYFFRPDMKVQFACSSTSTEGLFALKRSLNSTRESGTAFYNNFCLMNVTLNQEHNNSYIECQNSKNGDILRLRVYLFENTSAVVTQENSHSVMTPDNAPPTPRSTAVTITQKTLEMRKSAEPEIRINNKVTNISSPYEFFDGEILNITCKFSKATGIKLVYVNFEVDLSSQFTEFMNANEIYSKVTMKSSYKTAYIGCIVKQNASTNLEARVHFVKKTPEYMNKNRATEAGPCIYSYNNREIINKTCEFLGGTQRIPSLKSNTGDHSGIFLHGLKQSKVILQFINGINADVVVYKYSGQEILNLSWTLKPTKNTYRHILVTWKDKILTEVIQKFPTSHSLTSQTITLDASANLTKIQCLVGSPGSNLKEFWVLFYQTTDSSSNISRCILFKVLAAIGALVLCVIMVMLVYVVRKKLCKPEKANEDNEMRQDKTYDNPSYYLPDQNTESRSNITGQTHPNPECLYSQPIPKRERKAFENKEYGEVIEAPELLYNTIEECNKEHPKVIGGNGKYVNFDTENVVAENIDKENAEKEIYANVNNGEKDNELYCEVNLKN